MSRNTSRPLKALAASIAGILLSLGLCGMSGGNFLNAGQSTVMQFGVMLFFGSIAVGVASMLWLLIELVRYSDDEGTKLGLTDDKDEGDKR